MKITKPYNDKLLSFDESTKHYVLTKEYIKDEFNNPFKDDLVLDRRLKKNSRVVYNYIYKTGNNANREVVEFLLNRTEEGRSFMFDLLSAQMEADLETGINTLVNIPRIDIKTKQAISQGDMANSYMCQEALDILDTSSGRLGVNILYGAKYSPMLYLQLRRIMNDTNTK